MQERMKLTKSRSSAPIRRRAFPRHRVAFCRGVNDGLIRRSLSICGATESDSILYKVRPNDRHYLLAEDFVALGSEMHTVTEEQLFSAALMDEGEQVVHDHPEVQDIRLLGKDPLL